MRRALFMLFVVIFLVSSLSGDVGPNPLLVFYDVAEVSWDRVDEDLYIAIRELPPSVTTLGVVENLGGDPDWALKIGEILQQRRMTVRVGIECSSACIGMILGAPVRIAEEDARFWIHAVQAPDADPQTLAEWRAYVAWRVVKWGMSREFAEKYLVRDSGDKWLTARDALAVGILTDVISVGRSGRADAP